MMGGGTEGVRRAKLEDKESHEAYKQGQIASVSFNGQYFSTYSKRVSVDRIDPRLEEGFVHRVPDQRTSQAGFPTRMGIDVPVDTLKPQAPSERADEIDERTAKRGKRYRVLGFKYESVPGEDDGPRPFVKSDEPVTLK